MRGIFGAVRPLVARLLAPRPSARRSLVVLLLALVVIPLWQYRLTKPDVTHLPAYATRASTGVHSEPKFFFFLKHLGLYPLMTVAPVASDTKAEALRQLHDNAKDLRVDEQVTFRSGDRGRVYLYYLDWLVNRRSIAPKLLMPNYIGFTAALCALFAGFWWIRRSAFGAVIVLFLGSDPFQLFSSYRQENVFGWSVSIALLIMAIHLPIMVTRPTRSRWIWALPIGAGLLLASARTIRSEGTLIGASAMLAYLTLAGATWKKRVGLAVVLFVTMTLGTTGYSKFFLYKFDRAHGEMVKHGGTPYTGPLPIYHEVWHAVFCGLGDFDKKYGYVWDDRVAYAHAYPILKGKYGLVLPPWEPGWYTFNATYDGTGKYPIFFSEVDHYHDIIREKVVGDIKRDPRWYLDILWKRTIRVLEKTPPISVHLGKEGMHTTSPLIGFLCIPLAAFLALGRRWTDLKILIFTVPLSAPALIIFSDLGMTNYTTFHYFGVAILLGMTAAGARAWLARGPAAA